jgi:YD repeat-containing protein
MKRLLLAIALLAGAAAFPALAVDLQCGQPGNGSLLANGTSTVFTFRLRSGDSIVLRLIPNSPAINYNQPIEFDDPNGTPLRESFSTSNGAHIYNDLKVDGTYQATVKGNTASTFQMVYVPLNRACAANTSLPCGKSLTGSFAPGQMQTYQFNGKTGDMVSVRVATTDGSDNNANIFIIGFDSNSVLQPATKDQGFVFSLRGGVLPTYRLTTDGTQTFVMFESNGQLKLNYAINVVDLSGPCSAIAAGCGTSADGSLTDPLATGIYTLTANKGDLYRLRLLTTDSSGGLRAISQVFDPLGNPVDPATAVEATRFLTLPATGQYTVVVQDGSGVNTGSYALSLSRLNSPCNAQSLSCGVPVNGQVSGPLRTVAYSIDAQQGDVYMVRLLRTGAGVSFTPRIEVYAPDTGAQVQSVTAADVGSVTFTAPAAGTYTLLAFDGLDGKQTGAYTVWVARLNRPCNGAIGLSCLFLAPGTINQPLQTGLYSYPTAPGDSFTVRLLDLSGNLQSAVQVYDPRGVAVPGSPGTTKAVDVTASPGGAYTIVVTDQSRVPGQGTFGVEAVNTKGACGSPVPAGTSTSGLISGPAPFSVYTLSVTAGDSLLLRTAAFTPGFAANMDLYDPAGRRLGSSTSVIAPSALATGGTYTAVIAGSAPRTAGNFSFSWQSLTRPSANPLPCGQTTSGVLGADNQFWYYTLDAGEGDLLKVLLTRLPGTLNAQLELFDPKGARLAVNTNEITRKVSAGNYLVVVSPASAAAETGGFALALEKPNHPCSPNGLTCGQTVLRQVTAPGQLDAFPFSGNAGDAINISVTPRAGNISPVTELYDPSGNAVGAAGTTSLNPTLAATGQYTVTVHDRSGNTGSYRVGLQRAGNACAENDTEMPMITLRRPTGGDVIAGGSVFQIVWQSDDNEAVASHSIQLSTDGGKTFQPIAGGSGLSGIAQSFNWLVPSDIAPTRTGVIRVSASDRAGNTQSATSDVLALIGSGFTANVSATYEYDALNRLSKATYQDGRVIQYSYDAVGNLVGITVQ